MSARMISVSYNHQSDLSKSWVAGNTRFNDWFEFADWLKQLLEQNKPVLITEGHYV
jgi:hypothetical protein